MYLGVTCDWAYWYVPETGGVKVRPAKVTIRSSRSRTGQQGGPRPSDDKPWRSGMRKAGVQPVVVEEKNIVEKPLPEKPWRSNMRTNPKPAEPEIVSKPTVEERAWRNNMKKDTAKVEQNIPPVKVFWTLFILFANILYLFYVC